MSATLSVAADRLIGLTPFDTVYTAISDIATVLGAAVPHNNTYNPSSEYIKGESKGTLNFKETVLQDINNKVSGYSYYPWGFIQSISFQTRIETKCYVTTTGSGPLYDVFTTPYSSWKYVYSPNFHSTATLFPRFRQYYNYMTYQTYNEYVDDDIRPVFH